MAVVSFFAEILVMMVLPQFGSTSAVVSDVCSLWSVTPGTSNYDCSRKGLTFIPEPILDTTVTLRYTTNKLTTVPRGVFNHLKNLYEIDFMNNLIATIEPGAFDRLMKLQRLHLKDNRLKIIHQDMFRHLSSLEYIDLRNNEITSINRFAFFTAPNLNNVDFKDNPVECNCEERLLREFVDMRGSGNFINNTICTNLNFQPFMVLQPTQFPECPSGEYLFPPARSRYCYTCNSVSSLKECATQQQTQCIDAKATCYNRLEFTNTLQVYGGCSSYKNCIDWENQNRNTCIKDGSYVSCYVCYPSSLGNKNDPVGLMKTFTMVAMVIFDKQMTSGLRNTDSTEYAGFTLNLGVQVYNLIYGSNGTFAVDFKALREQPNGNGVSIVVAEFHIVCSTIWFVTRRRVADQITTTLVSNRIQGTEVTSAEVSILNNSNPFCPSSNIVDPVYGTFRWPQTPAGLSVVIQCPYQLEGSSKQQFTSRVCANENGEGRWASPTIKECPKADTTSRQLQSLADTVVTEDNVDTVSAETKTLSGNWQTFASSEVGWSVDIVDDIIKTDVSTSSKAVIDNTLQIINNVLFVGENVLTESQTDSKASSRLVSNIDTFVERIAIDNNNYREVTPNIAAVVSSTTADQFVGVSMSFEAYDQQALSDDKVTFQPGDAVPSSGQSGITIPKTVFSGLSRQKSNLVKKISSTIIREPKIFQTIVKPVEKEIVLASNKTVMAVRAINSNVIGTSVPGVSLDNLGDPVRIVFQHNKEAVSPACVYWESASDSWKSDGCVVNTTTEDYTVCHCSHLTNFALLMDVYGTGGGLSEADKLALAVISYIGCAISLIAVCLTLFTYLMFKKLRRDNPSKILMNLCLAIGFVDLVFVAGMQGYSSASPAGCKIVAILLHYFLLAAIFWMAVEAFYMYLALVKVFDTYIARFQLKSSLFGWGLPLVIVAVTAAVNKAENYGAQPGGICWLDRIPFYCAFLAPVCLILVLNSISFALVIRQISRRSSNKLTKSDTSSTAIRLRGAVSLIVLLGLTWLFGILAVDNFGVVFHYLFAIFNSLQGFFIFIFYCVLKKEAQQLWRRKLPCLKSAYEQTTSSTGANKGQAEQHDKLITYSNTCDQNTTSEISESTSCKDGRTDSTDISQSSRSTVTTTTAPKETKFRGNWQFSPGAEE